MTLIIGQNKQNVNSISKKEQHKKVLILSQSASQKIQKYKIKLQYCQKQRISSNVTYEKGIKQMGGCQQKQQQQNITNSEQMQKTITETDNQSTTTKLTQVKPATFVTEAKREMFKNRTSTSAAKKIQMQRELFNVVLLQAQHTSFLISNKIHFLEGSTNFVYMCDYYYSLYSDRAQPIMIPRNCQPNSELLFSNVRKPGINIILESVHRFYQGTQANGAASANQVNGNEDGDTCMIHVNLSKYGPVERKLLDVRDVYFNIPQNTQIKYFVTVDNGKRGVFLIEHISKQSKKYEILYINLLKTNKIKNPNHPSMLKRSSLSLVEQTPSPTPRSVIVQPQYLFPTPEQLRQPLSLSNGQKLISLLNSQFGDSLLLCTNNQIYEIQFEPASIFLKSFDINTKVRKYLKIPQPEKGEKSDKDIEIVDICYIVDGLRVYFFFKNGLVGWIQAMNIVYMTNIRDVIANANKKQDQFNVVNIYSLVGKIALLTDKNFVLIFKVSQNQLAFQKKIQLPAPSSIEVLWYNLTFLHRFDQLALVRTVKKQKQSLQILTKNLLSPNSQFCPLYQSPLQPIACSSLPSALKVITSKANNISLLVKDNSIQFYRFSGSTLDSEPIQHLFTKSFYEKPLYASIDPYCSNVCILFKEFVKFYKFKYQDIVQFYTYNVRNVTYVGYTDNGSYVVFVQDDRLYFLNSYTFQTVSTMEAYGDIKSVRYYDNILYLLLKNKLTKNTSETLTLQTYTCTSNRPFQQIWQQKLQPTQALLTDNKFVVIASAKEIVAYGRVLNEYHEETKPKNKGNIRLDNVDTVEVKYKRKVKMVDDSEFPTCLCLCEEFGVIFMGTNCGRVYQYLWPFSPDQQIQNYYQIQCSTSQISKIHPTSTLQKLYIFSRNKSICQLSLTQIIESDQMTNIYIINPKSLYPSESSSNKLKYQFSNREYLFPNHTSYIYEDIRQTNENIEQLKFILQKTKDDIDEYVTKTTEEYQKDIKGINNDKDRDVKGVKQELQKDQGRMVAEFQELQKQGEEELNCFKTKKEQQKNKYEQKLLQLYTQATRLRNIYSQLQKKQQKQRDTYLLQNTEIIQQTIAQGEQTEATFINNYNAIKEKTDIFFTLQNSEIRQKLDQQFFEYNQILRNTINYELESEEQRKQSLLGTKGYLQKEIINYRQRRDEFEGLIMETNMQISELYADREAYQGKQTYLKSELSKKQEMIEDKERELVMLIDCSTSMKKIKDTHEFELEEYEKQFEPINVKMSEIQGKVQKMNSQILRQYLNKVDKDKNIMQNTQRYEKLKKQREKAIQDKLGSLRKIEVFMAQLQLLLENPASQTLQQNLNYLSRGQKLILNQQQIQQKLQNTKLVRRKKFIGKQIEQYEKREQQMIRNQNQINRHYNQNTMLVREFNNLKQLNRKLEEMMKTMELKYITAKSSRLETPRKKVNSMIQFKKVSEKKLTPFQKHQLQFNDMFHYNKGLTSQTKLTRSGQSMSLLKTLIRDVQVTDSKYQKMEIIRDRIKSFVNPEIRIKKNLVTQRALFEKKKGQIGH